METGPALAAPLRVRSTSRHAPGNALGDRPALFVEIDVARDAACDRATVGRLMTDVAPDLGDEFQLARVPADVAPIAGCLAAVLAALLANGRDLPVAIVPLDPGPADTAWRIGVAEGIDGAPVGVLDLALELLLRALAGPPPDEELRARVEALLGSRFDRFDRNQRNLLATALARGDVGWRRSLQSPIGWVGEGSRRRRLRGAVSPHTRMPGATLAERKDEANARLAAAGLPVARQIRVADAKEACAAAERLGYPVVVKPVDCSNGRGVHVGLATGAQVAEAFADARRRSSLVVVESQLVGQAYRLLVIAGEVAGSILNAPGTLVGDGLRTIRELAAAADAAPPRRGPRALVRPLVLTDEMLTHLRHHGRDAETVLAPGEAATLHWHGHMSRGAIARAVPGAIHPDNRKAACQAAAVIGLDVAGIDLIVPDIARSWRGTGGGICEVNRSPGFRTHSIAEGGLAAGLSRYVEHLCDGVPATVPIIVFLGGEEFDAAALSLADRLAARGLAPGLAIGARYRAAGLPLTDPGPGSPLRVSRLVDDPAVDAIVVVAAPEHIAERGFGHGRADLAIVAEGAAGEAAGILAGLGAAIRPPSALGAPGLLDAILARHGGRA